MKSITQLQKEYPDVIKATLKTTEAMTLNEVRSVANLVHGEKSTVLQAKVTNKKAVIYVSKIAFEKGIKDCSPEFHLSFK